MKKSLLGLFLVLMSLDLGAQGLVSFGNNSSSALSNSVTGMRLPVGAGFAVQLYYAPALLGVETAPDDEMFVLLGGSVGIGPFPGLFTGGTRTTPPTTAPGEFAWFQVKAFETAFGSTYEEAVCAPLHPGLGRRGLVGKSKKLLVKTGSATPTPLPNHGLEGFTLYAAAPPRFISGPQSQTVLSGQTVRMGLLVLDGGTLADPGYHLTSLNYQWYFKNQSIPGATGETLTITNVQAQHAGAYFVTVMNCHGDDVSADAILQVVPSVFLRFQRSPSSVTLSWTNAGFCLQGAPRLEAPGVPSAWASIPGNSPVTLSSTGAMRFFRLISPCP